MRKTWSKWLLIACLWLLTATPGFSQERYTPEGRDRRRDPLEMREMKSWEKIRFDRDRFTQIERGMTEEEVLGMLGKPRAVEKQRRPKNRWTVHYLYPEGYIVNFRDGLVVGTKHDTEGPPNPWE